MENCIFCKIINGEAPSYKILEDENHLAFLSHNPNTEGVTIVVTKEHHPSDVTKLPDEVFCSLLLFTKQVSSMLTNAFDDVGRTAILAEGFGVDHVHAKLFPLHGTAMENWEQIKATETKFMPKYLGYVSSHGSQMKEPEELAKLALEIRRKNGIV